MPRRTNAWRTNASMDKCQYRHLSYKAFVFRGICLLTIFLPKNFCFKKKIEIFFQTDPLPTLLGNLTPPPSSLLLLLHGQLDLPAAVCRAVSLPQHEPHTQTTASPGRSGLRRSSTQTPLRPSFYTGIWSCSPPSSSTTHAYPHCILHSDP